MSGHAKNHTGKRFGRLTALRLLEIVDHRSRWLCLCDCGNECVTMGQSLLSGNTRSCGCLFVEARHEKGRNRTHGKSTTRTYHIWAGIKRRCYNKRDHAYPRYGGRGIVMCDRWRNSFEDFLSDMGECPDGLTVERKDNNKGYESSNCKWATYAEQNQNKRNVRRVVHDGELLTLLQIQQRTGLKYATVYYRNFVSPTIAKRAMAKESTLIWDDAE